LICPTKDALPVTTVKAAVSSQGHHSTRNYYENVETPRGRKYYSVMIKTVVGKPSLEDATSVIQLMSVLSKYAVI